MPKLTHSDGAEVEVREDQVPAYLGQGWTRVKALPAKVAAKKVAAERKAAARPAEK